MVLLLVFVAVLAVGCGASRPANRFIRYGDGGKTIELMEAPPAAIPTLSKAEREAAVERARRERGASSVVATIEAADSELREALAALELRASVPAYVRAGHAYARVGVYDRALDHFDRAIDLDKTSAAAYDARARVWRDWGLLAYALSDATRAVYFAPRSAPAHNTRGTILTLLGHCASARAAYQRALELDPGAVYAKDNLERQGAPECRPPVPSKASTPQPRPR
jgi:tetratricopeptide (TPR) repeat protein